MDSPVRKMQKRNDYNRHKLFRKIRRRRRAQAEQLSRIAEKELKKKLRVTPVKYDDGKITGYVRDKNDNPAAFDEDRGYYDYMQKVADDNYTNWKFKNAEEALVHTLNDNTYDYRGFYSSNEFDNTANAISHWPDSYKTVWHPTFSNQSIYSGKKSQYNPYGLVGGYWLGESFIPMAWQFLQNDAEYKNGKTTSGIHIKPSHRGRLTALKKRTGKSEAELYRTGSAATRKMITFARNARKWNK